MAIEHNFKMTNCDTDSISFSKQDGSPFSNEEQESLISEINELMEKHIVYEHDGYYDKVIILKAKNYILRDNDTQKVSLKGSSIRDQKKEPALREMMEVMFDDLLNNNGSNIKEIYEKYIVEANNIKDISRWCVKKSVTKSVLNPTRSTEQKVLDALKGIEIREGDKVWLYNALDGKIPQVLKVTGEAYCPLVKNRYPKMIDNRILKVIDSWDGDEEVLHYTKRVHSTLDILKNVLDMELFVKYHNKGNISLLQELIQNDIDGVIK